MLKLRNSTYFLVFSYTQIWCHWQGSETTGNTTTSCQFQCVHWQISWTSKLNPDCPSSWPALSLESVVPTGTTGKGVPVREQMPSPENQKVLIWGNICTALCLGIKMDKSLQKKASHETEKDVCQLCGATFTDKKDKHYLTMVKPDCTLALEELIGVIITADDL